MASLFGHTLCGTMFGVTREDAAERAEASLSESAAGYHRAKQTLEEARGDLVEKIIEAARSGIQQSQIVRITGYTREHVRRICRAAGIEADGPGES